MTIPSFVLIHRATLERLEGHSGQGPIYKDPEEIDCYIEPNKRKVQNNDGDEIITSALMLISPSLEVPPPGSKITFEGDEYEVVDTGPRDEILSNSRHHTEVDLE